MTVATEGYFGTTLAEVKVTSVVAGGPSEKAGLQVGDLILEMDGMPVKGGSGLALKRQLANIKHGDRVVLRVQRGSAGVVVVEIVAGS